MQAEKKRQTNYKYWQVERLKALYKELAAPKRFYYKSFVKVELKKGGHYFVSVVHDKPNDHIELTPKGHRNAKSVTTVKINGEDQVLEEYTCGLLYVPPTARKIFSMKYDDALCFVCDVDIARRNGKSMEEAVADWVEDAVHVPTKPYKVSLLNELKQRMIDVDKGITSYNNPRIKELRKQLTAATGEAPYIIRDSTQWPNQSTNKFSGELLKEFGSDPEIRDWIKANKESLDEEPDSKFIDKYKWDWVNIDYLEKYPND